MIGVVDGGVVVAGSVLADGTVVAGNVEPDDGDSASGGAAVPDEAQPASTRATRSARRRMPTECPKSASFTVRVPTVTRSGESYGECRLSR